mmetsp:Transcript_3234/g.12380  ORF Transcript_3234/g.12380 Transcript_3234/m.12380 type:complete len:126 (+) Transcript_3234:239-616(+)
MTGRLQRMGESCLEQVVSEEYRIWRKNVPLLYDLVVAHALEWPSLTVQWFPSRTHSEDIGNQKLILGTHTSSGEPNHLMIAEILLPSAPDGSDDNKPKCAATGSHKIQGGVQVRIKLVHLGEVNR